MYLLVLLTMASRCFGKTWVSLRKALDNSECFAYIEKQSYEKQSQADGDVDGHEHVGGGFVEDLAVSAEKKGGMPRRAFVKNIAKGAAVAAFGLRAITSSRESMADIANAGQWEDEERFWRLVKSQFMYERGLIYMNNGTLGVCPRPVFNAVVEAMAYQEQNPSGHYQWGLEEVREKAAGLVGASKGEIALIRNVTEGMNLVAVGLPLKKGDEVLTTNHEHPGGLGCWQYMAWKKGVVLKELPIPNPPESTDEVLDLFVRAISRRTKVISVSHIFFTTGLLFPVKQLCKLAHDKGIFVVLDAAHVPGMLHVDVHDIGCDFFAGNGHKWLLGPKTAGFLYVRREVQDQVQPLITNWASGYDGEGAGRLDAIGTFDVPIKIGMGAAIDFHQTIGLDRVEARCLGLMRSMKERLAKIPGVRIYTPMDPEMSSALVGFSVKNIPHHPLKKMLYDRYHIEVKLTPDGQGRELNSIRVSTHIYNTPEEVDPLVGAIEELAKEG